MLGNFSCFCFCRLKDLRIKFFQKNLSVRVSNSLDPDQDGHFVGPDLGPNCLQRLSAFDKKKDFSTFI